MSMQRPPHRRRCTCHATHSPWTSTRFARVHNPRSAAIIPSSSWAHQKKPAQLRARALQYSTPLLGPGSSGSGAPPTDARTKACSLSLFGVYRVGLLCICPAVVRGSGAGLAREVVRTADSRHTVRLGLLLSLVAGQGAPEGILRVCTP